MLHDIDSRRVKMNSTGRVEGDSIVGTDRECNRLPEAVSDPVSSEARLAPGLVGQVWSGVLGDFLLNLSTTFPTP